jgi:hypothetical protein
VKRKIIALTFLTGALMSSAFAQNAFYTRTGTGHLDLTPAGAAHLAQLPLRCMQQEFPYKTGIVFSDSSLVTNPKNYHPAFYGCFDWHSSVHGHWMLVRLLKSFPGMPKEKEIITKLSQNLTAANIAQEQEIFKGKENKSFERIYGWSWLLQLQRELLTWNDPLGKQLATNVQPLATQFSKAYIDFLGKLVYPIRVGEHTNLAFGLSLAWDYAETTRDTALQTAIRQAAIRFYAKDKNGPVAFEPGGYDFLSPCLEEADLMWRVLPHAEYQTWIHNFLPDLFAPSITAFPVAQVKDVTDGKLVHLHGLNLSRAWCLYGIARHTDKNKEPMLRLANAFLEAAIPNVASGDYAGEHWLASFAVYALTTENN